MFVEVGTAQGGTHFLISHALPTITRTIAVDLFVWNTRILKHFSRPGVHQTFIHGSSYSQDTIQRVIRELNGAPIDVLFIDGDHSYEGVKQDFLMYRQLVRDGGLIAFHDIVPDHKTRFGLDTGRWAGDVPVIWSQLKPLFKSREFVEDPEQDGLGIGALVHKSDITPFS